MNYDDNGLFGGVFWLFSLFWLILILVAGWKMYVKGGQHGWVCLIPIINILGLLKIVHRPWWWLLLMLIPFVNFVVWVIIAAGSCQGVRPWHRDGPCAHLPDSRSATWSWASAAPSTGSRRTRCSADPASRNVTPRGRS